MKNLESMNILEIAEGIERMTAGRIADDKAMWMALAFKELDEETFDLDDWIFVEELGYRIKKSELHRLSRVAA